MNKNKIINFLKNENCILSVLFLFFCFLASFKIFDRIEIFTNPSTEERRHLHRGDGYTEEAFVLPAMNYWEKSGGLFSTYGIPCTNDQIESCNGYLHYPSSPFIFSYMLRKVLKDLPLVRWVTFFLSFLFSFLAIYLLFKSLKIRFIFALPILWFLYRSTGWMIYSDNLFWHGISTNLLFLFCVFTFTRFNLKIIFSLLTVLLWINPESSLIYFVFCILLSISNPNSKFRDVIFTLSSASVLFFLLKISQNAIYLNSFHQAVFDIVEILQRRMYGSNDVGFQFSFSMINYILDLAGKYHLLFSKQSAFVLLFMLFIVFLKKKFLVLFLTLSFFSWSLFMVQHSSNHIFTLRHGVWALVFVYPFFIKEIYTSLKSIPIR